MNILKIGIIAHSEFYALYINELLEKIGYPTKVFLLQKSQETPQLPIQFMDIVIIQLGKPTTMTLARKITELGIPLLVIVDNQQDLHHDGHASNITFIPTPISMKKLKNGLEMALLTTNAPQIRAQIHHNFSTDQELYCKKKGIYHRLVIQNMLYIQGSDNYVAIQFPDKKILMPGRLSDMLQLLIHHDFMQIHRSYVINLKKATTINFEKNRMMVGGHAIPFSRRIKAVLKKMFL